MAKPLPTALIDSFLTWEQLPQEEHGKEVPSTGKSEEELAKFTVDERLSDVERAVLFLTGGQPIQQRHAIRNLPSTIRGRGRPAWDAIAQPLKAALNRMDADAQVEAAQALSEIAKERLMPNADLQACLLPLLCRNINKEKSEEETEGWLKALFELVPLLDKEVLRSEVLSLALSKGDVEESVNSRAICARILGAVAPCLGKDEVERTFFKKAMTMCQDVDYHMRISMCEQLVAIGRTVGREPTSKHILEELFELLQDEEVQVRASAFKALVALLDLLPSDLRKSRVIPVLRDHMQPFDMDPTVQRCIASHFGMMLMLIKSDLDTDDFQLFFSGFKHLCGKSDVEMRRACAQQLPLVVKAAASVNPMVYGQQFHDTLVSLINDNDEEVRINIASQLHEVTRLSGRECATLMSRPVVRLLRDESQRVQMAVLPMFNVTLQHFVTALPDESKRETVLMDIVRALVDLEAGTNRNWRLQANLASVFSSFPQSFSSDQIYEHFLPMAYRFLSGSFAAVRPVAAEGVTAFLRYNKRDKQRAEIFMRLIRDYARGKSFTQRIAFGEIAQHLVKRFSSRFIKDWVFDLCLELLYDPVPNVRLQVTSLLPLLKQTIKLPEDVDLLERLNNAMSNSMTDNDRDVSMTARQINDTFKRTPVRMGGGVSSMDVNGLLGGVASYETEDRKKEEEEGEYPGFTPEDAKELKAEILQMSVKKRVPAAEAGGRALVGRRSTSGEARLGGPPTGRPAMGLSGLAQSKSSGSMLVSPSAVRTTPAAGSSPGLRSASASSPVAATTKPTVFQNSPSKTGLLAGSGPAKSPAPVPRAPAAAATTAAAGSASTLKLPGINKPPTSSATPLARPAPVSASKPATSLTTSRAPVGSVAARKPSK
mmetsp:Transcript_9565/g.20370  ORF Transcript_9565/g.20370 Transcript_9565/m.20370 type:complete len:882 (+) Transcript_9565:180-2825(+)|eukprot:CAMPEP_0202904272 /NCGR_PEP_ID=MMETSP1392-20130828/28607_1 /ASSEMBLY_ACC=CAM_ASM_000868 /TAXON_ID=225041 /ORGANISM="Chlamydomonas chlamydogama, Strain SAG 11-48b" /LENGTH=881 /DNA_ID=CAMNT_0049591823 /DNA_START=111 /DNA_END=2756 /DNA_ORIENTATION=-